MCSHNPIHCILPPHVLDRMSQSADPKVRKRAIDNIAAAAQARAVRGVLRSMPFMAAIPSPAQTRHRLVYDMENTQSMFRLPGKLIRKEGDGPVADAAINEAYDYSGKTYDFFKAIFGRNSLDNRGMSLISSVHFGDSFDNAFWNGEQMVYGDGDEQIFTRFTKSLDVVAHELSHGVTSFTSNLEYRDQSGALNESFSDVMGSLVKQWALSQTAGNADWLVGKEILVPAPTRRALRDLANPGTAYKNDPLLGDDPQPAHMDNLYTGSADEGGVHINSGIPNKAFCLFAKALGGNAWGNAGHVWYDAYLALQPLSQFSDLKDSTIQVAVGRFGAASAEKQALLTAWGQVGV